MGTTVTTTATYRFDPCDIALVDALRAELGCSETLAWVLARRGIDAAAARAMIDQDPAREQELLHDPLLLGDMAAAVERVRYAIEQHEQIVVHGDYDADGICATTLLVEGLEELGASVAPFLPERFTNGYGLHVEQIEAFASSGVRLVIAVDCGITAVDAVARASELGMDVIICDHHRPAAELPAAIIASARPSEYPFPDICATVVASKLLVALGGPSGDRQHELEAIATIADCMPLLDENRVIVQRGLRALRATTRPGLLALMNESGLRPREVDAEAVGFKLAPRLNATGRIAHPQLGYDVLRADEFAATPLAAEITAVNEERRAITTSVTSEAVAQIEAWSDARRAAKIYVVHGPGWHQGVVGIVASKLVERYGRPVLVIADGEPARGSGRSVPQVDLHAALAACEQHLLRWGGHEQAAGVTVDPAQLDALQSALAAWADVHVSEEQLVPCDSVDAIVTGADLTLDLVHELDRLGPFGTGWERPRLVALDARIQNASAVGDGTHLRGQLEVDGRGVAAIGFGLATHMPTLATGAAVDIALVPNINRFRGAETMQASLERIYVHTPGEWELPGGWCHEHAIRFGRQLPAAAAVQAALAGFDVEQLAELDPSHLPSLDALLTRAGVVDLRSRALGVAHVAQLVAAGRSVLVVSADAARRGERFSDVVRPGRIAASMAATMADERIAAPTLARHLDELAHSDAAQRFVLSDYATLATVLDAAGAPFDVVVVLDPPHSPAHVALLAQIDPPVHIVAGAREHEFSAATLAAKQDVRTTFGAAWKATRTNGPCSLDELLLRALGDAPFSPPPSAIVHGLRSLIARGMFELDADGTVRALHPAAATASTSA
jgi:single-stranded-DNA-specific exonuclease